MHFARLSAISSKNKNGIGINSDIGGLCPVETTMRRHTNALRVTLPRRAPDARRVELELVDFRGHRHHAMASSDDETAER